MSNDRDRKRARFEHDVRWYLVPAAAAAAAAALFALAWISGPPAPVRDDAVPTAFASSWIVAPPRSPLASDDDAARLSLRAPGEPDLSRPLHESAYETH